MNVTTEIKKIGSLSLVVGFIGLLSSISTFIAFGIPGIIISIVLTLAVFITSILILRPMLIRNARGVTMLEALTIAGLVDIESREDEKRTLPPYEFYKLAQHEIVISSITAAMTFQLNINLLKELLDDGRKIYILILHPDSPELNIYEERSLRRKKDIQRVMTAIKEEGLINHPGFQIRFRERIPPFTAVMIDGDIFPTGKTPRDNQAQIRIEPITLYSPQQKGVVLQFRKLHEKKKCPFDYFAEDLRKQWSLEGETLLKPSKD